MLQVDQEYAIVQFYQRRWLVRGNLSNLPAVRSSPIRIERPLQTSTHAQNVRPTQAPFRT